MHNASSTVNTLSNIRFSSALASNGVQIGARFTATNTADFFVAVQDPAGNSQALTVKSTGNVGIGTSSPAAELHISKSADAGNAEIILENSFTNTGSSTDESTQIQGRFGGYDASYILTGKEGDYTTAALRKSYLAFSTRTATTGMTEKLRIDSSGNVEVKTGNLVIGTNGKGIDFSANADSSATGASTTSELLDDYEEGTWTVGVSSSSGGSLTLSNNSGYYTKVGNMVTVWFHQLTWTAKTGLGGSLRITGLPFTVGTTRSAGSAGGSPSGTFASINTLAVAVDPNTTFIYLVSKAATNNTYIHMGNGHIGAAGTIYGMTLTYRV
jgi:hypothetical protein